MLRSGGLSALCVSFWGSFLAQLDANSSDLDNPASKAGSLPLPDSILGSSPPLKFSPPLTWEIPSFQISLPAHLGSAYPDFTSGLLPRMLLLGHTGQSEN